ncbi:MAG TPA: hypothetical protein V6C57_04680 [Coleofasciculaceae cyanobacterium]
MPRHWVEEILDAGEMILPNLEHMFRFTHLITYANAIRKCLQLRLGVTQLQHEFH